MRKHISALIVAMGAFFVLKQAEGVAVMLTVKNLLSHSAKVCVFLSSEAICRKFFADAEAEGFLFGGKMKPTDHEASDCIYVVHDDFTINSVGFCGHAMLNVRSKNKGVSVVDSARYILGKHDYSYKRSK